MSETCKYKYTYNEGLQKANNHPDVCGRPVAELCDCGCRPENEGLGPHDKACFWHCACEKSYLSPGRVKRGSSDLKSMLEQALREDCYLEGAFLRDAKLEAANLVGALLPLADLQNATLDGADLTDAWLWHADLEDAHLWNVTLDGCMLREANLRNADFYQFEPRKLVDVQLHRAHMDRRTDLGNIIWGRVWEEKDAEEQEEKGNFSEAANEWRDAAGVCGALEQYYRERSDYQGSEEFYLRKMKCLHEGARVEALRSPCSLRRRWDCAVWWLHRWGWGYGVIPLLLWVWIGGVILVWTLLFIGTGVEKPPAGGLQAYPPISARAFVPDGPRPVAAPNPHPYRNPGPSWQHPNPPWTNPRAVCARWADGGFWDAFALSLITFSTLGYGNWHPGSHWGDSFGHIIAGAEALLGVLLCAAFLVSLATKYVHRA